ncbi:lipid IV(A) 3-deoxy-D-manno-octulosonic acid transferase [Vibrio aphrogenes]|uniref:lipid IV(A) 3-deoxy-D-manno-octulosonic acid transferase n=1 Tax=Vibrio aphrogenes TaxID=1891186 RepID=UPI000B353758|nr:lipid IV(A) 3-deoxy-D-manno-octulosonic acid transferase [Vibrio aphrogenes]
MHIEHYKGVFVIRYFYTLLLFLLSPLLLVTLYKKKPGKPPFGSRWKEHFGITPVLKNQSQRPIWVHTVSVGETIAATPFIRALKQQYPNIPIVITTTTSTGAQQAEKLSDIAEHRYMPIDLPFAIKGFLKAIKPQKMLIMETELWPNVLHYAHQSGAPISVINARLSERSAQRYKKFQPIFNLLANNLSQILCQHTDDAERFIRLGIKNNKIKITGSLKFDISITEEIKQKAQNLRATLGTNRFIWIAASTHEGEDDIILSAHQKLLIKHPNALLILVPRHPERFHNVLLLCQNKKFNTVSRTSNQPVNLTTEIYLGDTMGEMMTLIGASDACFIGGSLIGNKVGGHNVLEPAALSKPIMTGPSYFNFTDIVERLNSCRALSITKNDNDIFNTLDSLISNDEMESMGKAAKSFVESNQGAIAKTLRIIDEIH